jgi:hypothetical protein
VCGSRKILIFLFVVILVCRTDGNIVCVAELCVEVEG